MGLNTQQQEAVDTLAGPVLILAGAGSGKTRVIINRIANLIQHGVDSGNILAVTFTNKAATEMRERVSDLLSASQASKLTVSTFHSFCLNVLRRFIHRLGFNRHFAIASEGYQRGLIKEIVTEQRMIGPGCDPYLWLSIISKAKANLEEPDDVREKPIVRAGDVATVYSIYQSRLKQMDLVDFDDLLCLTVKLWRENPDVLKSYQDIYKYIMIDEYQDTNGVQLAIMAMLAGTSKNICVVGDDDQSIYGWRGASLGNILDFEKHFPGARTIRLEQNYRSTNTILKAANALIAKNVMRKEKTLWSNQGDGDRILCVPCADETMEASFVCDYIRDQARNENWDDFAVLFRAGHQSRVLEEAFHRKGVPYLLVGANSFYKRKEVLDAIAFLKLLNNPKDDMAMLQIINVPQRGVGDATVEKLRDLRTATHLSIFELLEYDSFVKSVSADIAGNLHSFATIFKDMRSRLPEHGAVLPYARELLNALDYYKGLMHMYKPREDALKRADNVREFLNSIAEYDESKHNAGSLQEYLEQFDLQDAHDRKVDKNKKNGPAVTLMTIHASKGLEFPTVFVVGLEQGLFPHKQSMDEGNLEEERRLCYVAITRARVNLLLTRADKRRIMNRVELTRPSMFIDEIPEELIEFSTPEKAIKPVSLAQSEDNLARLKALLDD